MLESDKWLRERLAELEARLKMFRLPSASLPAVPAASVDVGGLRSLEASAGKAIASMRDRIRRMSDQIAVQPQSLRSTNMDLTLLQIQVDGLFQTLDIIVDAITLRADTETGLLLAGSDRVVAAALDRKIPGYTAPAVITYLESGSRGGAITRARTRLPGGVVLPLALVRVSTESLPTRLSSMLHEAGHQLSADLDMLTEAEALIRETALSILRDPNSAALWASWTSELLADAWGTALGGGAPAIDGLQRVLSIPTPLLYAIRRGDPHPPGAVRVPFSLAMARQLHPDPLLDRLAMRFAETFGPWSVAPALAQPIALLAAAAAPVARALLAHRFRGLGQQTIAEVCDLEDVSPRKARLLLAQDEALHPENLARRKPLQALALLGYARIGGNLTPAMHDLHARKWLQAIARDRFRSYEAKERAYNQTGSNPYLTMRSAS